MKWFYSCTNALTVLTKSTNLKKPVFEKVASNLEHFSFVVKNITARDPHTRLKTFKQFLAVLYDLFKVANSKYYEYYLPDFEIVIASVSINQNLHLKTYITLLILMWLNDITNYLSLQSAEQLPHSFLKSDV